MPLPLVLTVSVGFAGLSLFMGGVLFGRRRPRSPVRALDEPAAAAGPATEPLAQGVRGEQRRALRQSGTWIQIFLRSPESRGPVVEAHVIDFGPGGLGLMLLQPVTVGQVFEARSARASGGVPWVRVEVKTCQQLDQTIWRAGCHVEDLTLWDSLR